MQRTLLFTVATAAGFAAANMGQAVVENNCAYPIYMQNTPASGNGYEAIKKTLNAGETYTQTWAPTTQGGWSIKLSKIPDSFENNILQYEYTCQNDGIIWYDLSEVNGNPFKGDWLISAPETSGCDPKQAAYLFWNDDANGMQSSCPQETDITVTLCNASGSGSSNSSSSAGSPSPSPAPASSSAAVPAPAPSSSSSSSSSAAPATNTGGLLSDLGNVLQFSADGKQVVGGGEKAIKDNVAKAQTTTLATSVKSADNHNYVATVTDVVTHVANVYVTQRAEPQLRHRHHARHGH